MFFPTAVMVVVVTTLVVVHPAPTDPVSPIDGANTHPAPAPKVPASAGDETKPHALFTMWYLFKIVADASWSIQGWAYPCVRRSHPMPIPAA